MSRERNEEIEQVVSSGELDPDLRAQLAEFERVMDACAEGDLTRRLETNVENEALASVAVSFNEMVETLAHRTDDVKQYAETVAAASEDVAAGAAEVREATEGASERSEDIAMSTAEQKQRLETVSAEMESLSASIEEVSASARTVAETAAETLRRGEEGQEAARHAVEEIDEIRETTNETVGKIRQLDEQMDEIETIVDLISDIADETNLLALNANIEAARAGEAGDGFAVVASNVKQLATETKEAVDQISSVVDDVQTQTTAAVADIEAMQDNVESGVDTIETALEALDDIGDRIQDTNDGIQEINTAAEEQADAAQRIFASVETVADLSRDLDQQGDDVAQSVGEQSAALDQVVGSVDSLTGDVTALASTLAAIETATELDVTTTSARAQSVAATDRQATDTSMATIANLDNSYWLSWAKGYREAAGALGYRTDIQTNDGDVDRQFQQFETAIEGGTDAIVGQTYTNEAARDLADLCVAAGVPTVLAVTIANWYTPHDAGAEYVQFFTPHFVNHAYTAAELLFESMGGEGGFVHIEGNRGTAPNHGRNRGLALALEDYPGIDLLGPRREGKFLEDTAREAMADLVAEHGDDIQGFFAQNDAMAVGGLSVLQDHDIDVPVVGIDASERGLVRVLNGEMVGTVSGMGPWQAAWSLAKVHDFRNGHRLEPAERMLSFNAPLCVRDPETWRDTIDRIPVVDAGTYKEDVFESETPYDWRRMSVVEAGDGWDPQAQLQPIRRDDLEPLLGWDPDAKPAGYDLPPVFDDERAMDGIEQLYADQFRTDPLVR